MVKWGLLSNKIIINMTAKIQLLPDSTINQIAAGEVIENPSSAIKELIDNSIDAKASEIIIEIKDGGRQLIRISDNGCGMNKEDALLCLKRHATSKIAKLEDIYGIDSMGFRGEAIPSIASISKFTLMTCTKENANKQDGTMLLVDGGTVVKTCPVARSQGTTIEVKSLFFNVPVRKKFQKSSASDQRAILKMVSSLAMANPTISFQLISNQQTMLATRKHKGSFIEHFKSQTEGVLGKNFLNDMLEIDVEEPEFKLQGFISSVLKTRHNRTGQFLFINRRPVYSFLVSSTIRDVYGTALDSKQYPLFALHLTLKGDLVDVNVHPQKKEVRFQNGQQLKSFIFHSIDRVLQGKINFSSDFGSKSTSISSFSSESPDFPESSFASSSKSPFASSPSSSFNSSFSSKSSKSPFASSPSSFSSSKPPFASSPSSSFNFSFSSKSSKSPFSSSSVSSFPSFDSPSFTSDTTNTIQNQDNLDPLQTAATATTLEIPQKHIFVLNTLPNYILVDPSQLSLNLPPEIASKNTPGSLLIFNQFRCCFRIQYDFLKEQKTTLEVQNLLIPITLEFSQVEAQLLNEMLEDLNALGIKIKEFGNHSFMVDAIPTTIKENQVHNFLTTMIHDLQDLKGGAIRKKEQKKILAKKTAKTMMPKNKRISQEEAQYLLNQLIKTSQPFKSPDGLPCFTLFTQEDIEKKFTLC